MSQPFYQGRHSALYDLFYSDKPYAQEAEFIHHCLQQYGSTPIKRILELACGTGTHAFLLEKFGYEILATDASADMLEQAKKKAIATGSRVVFKQQDMTELQSQKPPLDAVYCLFDSIGYVLTNENIKRTLKGVMDNLQPKGLFLMEFWNAGAMIRNFSPIRILRRKIEKADILRISETVLDIPTQTCTVDYNIYEFHEDNTYVHIRETHKNRYFLLQEMAQFLSQAGLTPLKWFSGFTANEIINENTWHIVALACKP
jgi:SAM-dependent methyltransferase